MLQKRKGKLVDTVLCEVREGENKIQREGDTREKKAGSRLTKPRDALNCVLFPPERNARFSRGKERSRRGDIEVKALRVRNS